MWLSRISIQYPVFASMMMLTIMVLGLFSYKNLEIDQFPEIKFPVAVVHTQYDGATADVVETEVTQKIEDAVNRVPGIEEVTSYSFQDSSIVVAQFNLSVNPDVANQDLRDKLDLVTPFLRKEVQRPRLLRYDPSEAPIIYIGLTSERTDIKTLTNLAHKTITKRLEAVEGVGSVNVVGGQERVLQILPNLEQLSRYGIALTDIILAVNAKNQAPPSGNLDNGSRNIAIQLSGKLQTLQDFENLIIASRQGIPIYLHQVATIVDGYRSAKNRASLNQTPALFISVVRAQGKNIVKTADNIYATLEELQKELPKDVRLQIVDDTSKEIRQIVRSVQRTLLEGAIITILVVFLFLGSWRSTIITGLALPISLIGTYFFMYASGFTINMITLMALSLCIGLLIDDAIVVRENIVRHIAMGKNHHQAALEGTTEIGLAVLATTLCIVAVFLPIGFMGGIIGKVFHQFGITVAAAVLISMFVSFTLDPMLSSIWPDPDITVMQHNSVPSTRFKRLLSFFDKMIQKLSEFYGSCLIWSLRHKITTLCVAILSLLLSLWVIQLLGTEFTPKPDMGKFHIQFQVPSGSSMQLTLSKAHQIENKVKTLPDVDSTYSLVNEGLGLGSDFNKGIVNVILKPRQQRRSLNELIPEVRRQLAGVGGVKIMTVGVQDETGDNKALRYFILGPDLKELKRLGEEAHEKISKIRGITEVENTLANQKPVIALQLKAQEAANLGITIDSLSKILKPLLNGDAISIWTTTEQENHNVIVELPALAKQNIGTLNKIQVPTSIRLPDGSTLMVPLRQIATIQHSMTPRLIIRKDKQRAVEISANVSGLSPGEGAKEFEKALNSIQWPPGYRFEVSGVTKTMNETVGFAIQALALAIIFLYIILASQFGSFFQPLAIMSSLPLTLIGSSFMLAMFGSTINVFSIIGFIMLMGLVTKNAILLVDFANQARKGIDGQPPLGIEQALILAAKIRLRPILMTTLAMILGMVPLAFNLDEGAEQGGALGQTIIGGLVTSSILTLVVVPVIYIYLEQFSGLLKKVWQRI